MREIQVDLKKTEHRIREHRYLTILDTGQVSREALRAFPGHQYHMWQTLVRSAAQFVQRFGDRPYGGFFVGDLEAEIESRTGILDLARKLDMSEDDLRLYQPTAADSGRFCLRRLFCLAFRLRLCRTDCLRPGPQSCRVGPQLLAHGQCAPLALRIWQSRHGLS